MNLGQFQLFNQLIKTNQMISCQKQTEREGFEPSIELPLYSISSAAPSTARPPLQDRLSKAESSRLLAPLEQLKNLPLSAIGFLIVEVHSLRDLGSLLPKRNF